MIKDTKGGFLISQIKQIQGRIFEKILSRAGIEEYNGAQGRILYVLWNEDGLPIIELSKRTGLAKTTLTGMLDRMEAQGHIKRNYDKADRRQIRITLTENTRSLKADYERISMQMNELFYSGFSDDEIIGFERQLSRVLNNLIEGEKTL